MAPNRAGEPAHLSEDDLIAAYFAPLAGAGGLGLLDDVARLAVPAGRDLVMTNDALVSGVHFLPDDAPDAVARKALRVNLSDLAAKGAEPLGFLLALALPADGWTSAWLAAFAHGLGDDSRRYACPLLGGDTVRTPGPLTLSVTALGTVPSGRMPARTGVKPGDCLYVSGTIGDAALGLRIWQPRPGDTGWIGALHSRHAAALCERYLLPSPRLGLRDAMLGHARAGMDVSDGLVGDLSKMLRVSGVGADVDLGRVPLSEAARAAVSLAGDLFDLAVTGGDDYEVLVAVGPDGAAAFERAAAAAGIDVTRIGTATDRRGEPVRFRRPDGGTRTFRVGSYSHF